MRNFRHPHPLSLEEGGHLELVNQLAEDGRAVDDPLVLQAPGQVDAIVLADILHGLRGQQTGMGQDTHGIEDMPSGVEITGEGTVGHPGQLGQPTLTDEFVLVVEVDHKTE